LALNITGQGLAAHTTGEDVPHVSQSPSLEAVGNSFETNVCPSDASSVSCAAIMLENSKLFDRSSSSLFVGAGAFHPVLLYSLDRNEGFSIVSSSGTVGSWGGIGRMSIRYCSEGTDVSPDVPDDPDVPP